MRFLECNVRGIILLLISAFVLSCQVPVRGTGEEERATQQHHNHVTLSHLEGLLGVWEQADDKGNSTGEVITEFRSTAGGAAIVEIIFPGQPHEMVTLYYTSPEGLFMTHYCAVGNHPNLAASIDKATGDLLFRCMGAGANFHACASTNHMHDVRYHLEGDHLTATWHSMEDGKLGDDLVFSLVRRKSELP